MGIKDSIKDRAKEEIKNKAKAIGKKIIIKTAPVLLGIIVVAGGFFVITGAIKDAAEKVVKAATSLFSSDFDNTSDKPTIIIDDKTIKAITDEMKENAIDIDETFLTDNLLKKSLEAYYATQYPYIDGIDYTDDMVKGSIYLRRGDNNNYLTYINYNSFKEKLGEGKTETNVNDAKKYFSMDDDDNIVIATWSKSSETSQCADNGYKKEVSEESGYSITEYKIDQKSIATQYAMSYKLPILLANLYSNEGFGLAVAELGKNAKIELTVLDFTTQTETVNKEYFKMNYKVNGTYNFSDSDLNIPNLNMQNVPDKTGNLKELIWSDDYTGNPYKITTQISEENSITIKTSLVDTWIAKGEITDITKNTNTTSNSDNPDTTQMDNDPKDYTVDSNITITEEQQAELNSDIFSGMTNEEKFNYLSKKLDLNINVYKKMTEHSMSTSVTTTTTEYTSSDMELVDNTDSFLALIRANGNGEFDPKGELVEYYRKGNSYTSSGIEGEASTDNNQDVSHIAGDWTQYYQNDYVKVRYGSGTIASCGCGPTSFAMVATHITGKTITPADAVTWCGNSYYVFGAGTSWSYFAAAAKHFKLNCNVTQTTNISEVTKALQKGNVVISSQGAGLFTAKGHYIVLSGINNGKITVKDPNKNNAVSKGYNNRAFTSAEINQAAKQYWIFNVN